jgi:glycosyltransferase involved in cell wall biosynthesis
MIIGIDGRLANMEQRAGTGNICFEMLCAMAPLRGTDQLRVYLDGPPCADFPVRPPEVEIRQLPAGRFWTQRILARELRRNPPGAFYTPSLQMPFWVRCPRVATVLDLAYYDFGDQFTWTRRTQARLGTWMVLRQAAHLMSISEATKTDLITRFGYDPGRVTVAPLGVAADFLPKAGAAAAVLRAKFDLPDRYILFVGRIQPRKNIARLVHAFERLLARCPGLPHHLVVAGHTGWLYDEIFQAVEKSPVKERIQFLGYVHHEHEMPTVIAGADALALVSLWEGFGLPLVEAMQCGTAVLTADCSSMPEVVGDAGVIVDPTDVEAISDALERLVTDDAWRAKLETRGRERARCFTWPAAAQRTLDVLRALGAGREPARNV